jgi:hypothetical protein
MQAIRAFEKFPVSTIVLSNLVSMSIYGLGFFIVLQTGAVFSFSYLAYVLLMEFRLLKSSCVNCYYWGKACGFGKGRVSAFFFKKGDPSKFCSHSIAWKDMIPDLLISLVPVLIGIVLIIIHFNLVILFAVILLILLTTLGNGIIRGKLTCQHCKQKEIGCPADILFNKK